MKTYEKIRLFRELNQWSQEYMAEQLNMTTSGYAKIEQGKSRIHIDKLQKIAQIFNINTHELLDDGDFVVCVNGNNSIHNSNNRYSGNIHLNYEIEKLNLTISHQQDIIARQQNELETLKSLIDILKNKP